MSLSEILTYLISGFPVAPEFIDPGYPGWLQKFGGLQLTLIITVVSLLLGTILGAALALARTGALRESGNRRPFLGHLYRVSVSWPAIAVTEVIRGLPVMILVLLTFYLPYSLWGVRIPPVILAVTAFSLYAGVYLGEVFRSGFRAVDEGTLDVARVMGLSRWQTLRHLKLPIAFRTMTPAMLGVGITVFKDTSVLTVVAAPEITYTARQLFVTEPGDYLLIFILILAIYCGGASIASYLVRRLESHWKMEGT